MTTKESRTATWNWRDEFDAKLLKQGQEFLDTHRCWGTLRDNEKSFKSFYLSVSGVRDVGARYIPASYSMCVEYNEHQEAYSRMIQKKRKQYWYYSNPGTSSQSGVFYCTCKPAENNGKCKHMAAVGLYLENTYPDAFTFTETPEEVKEREEKEQAVLKLKAESIPVASHLLSEAPNDKEFYFPLPQALDGWIVTPAVKKETAAISTINAKPSLEFGEDGQQTLGLDYQLGLSKCSILLKHDGPAAIQCSCDEVDPYSSPRRICPHLLKGTETLWKYIQEENPGDVTDKTGYNLLNNLTISAEKKQAGTLQPKLHLTPMLDWNYNTPRLRFTISLPNGKSYILKALPAFTKAVLAKGTFEFSKNNSVDFSECTFDKESQPFFALLQSQYADNSSAPRLLNSKSELSASAADANTGIWLNGSILDAFYDTAHGMRIDCDSYTYGSISIQVAYHDVQILFTVDPIERSGVIDGVTIKGTIPVIFEGATYRYTLDRHNLSRLSEEDLHVLEPYSKMFGFKDTFTGTIGKKHLPVFLYRTLEQFRKNPHIILTDHVTGRIDEAVPPKGEYVYTLDLNENHHFFTCEATVSYGDNTFPLPVPSTASKEIIRDPELEGLALNAAKRSFPSWNSQDGRGLCPASEDTLFNILTTGTAAMENYGIVRASADFPGIRVRQVPTPTFRIAISSGLLDLSLHTTDLSEDELLEVLRAYRAKKRYVRLRSGDFITLEQEVPFKTLEDLLADMGVTLEEAIKSKTHVPLFRALYVNQLLETHEELVGSRDRTFRALIKNFKTIRESDDEVPQNLDSILRPYQVYGYKWLRTLARAGFGGILADEMGLGKTIQMLGVISAMKSEGETRPSLIACPASLVFNWKEEASKFTPELKVVTLSGTQSERRSLLKAAAGEEAADLYIASYDIVRNDVLLFEPVQFNCIVLDEAQFIKNTKAGITKAVKVLHAKHRFALTGTPIENRLSELWSIMDFLMPGFLYSESEFQKNYETPIMKQKDEDKTARLAQMTGPFILRRLKADVLKELPDKLEEVRTAMMEKEQRRLYDAQVVHMKQLLESGGNTGEDKLRILAEITRLRQLCCDPSLLFEDYKGKSAKREMCLDLIESAIDGGHRMLLFSQFTSMLALLEEDLKSHRIPYFKITGSTPKQERLRLVNEFNSDNTPVFLISLRAGGTGLNLTGADMVIHYDPWWNLAVQNQATDRAHKIGQTRQVTVYKLVASSTIEEKIVQLQNAKKELAEAILSGESQSLMSLSNEELMALLS